ncbi:dCTP deaminase [Candidatus Sumerlaeota bacterium]|nr:dCTP deaminase [Candidatus Sumerlaeota bacterium]
MAPKPDSWIHRMALEHGMIEPFADRQVREGVISYGLSAYGYDMRISDEFHALNPGQCDLLDPKNMREDFFTTLHAPHYDIPPNGIVICRSVEYFRIPRNVITITQGKSTYARCGVVVNITPFEPEWEGHVTISVSNTAPVPARIYANEGLAQVVFLESDEDCEISYADKKGKYQASKGVTHAKVETSQ